MSQYLKLEVASSIPFDNSNNNFVSDNVQNAIEEAQLAAEGKPRLPLFYWDWSTTQSPVYLYFFGQVRCDSAPFIAPFSTMSLREFIVTGSRNNTNANCLFAVYQTQSGLPSFGTLPTASNQGLTYTQTDYPYPNLSYVTISLVNNGASKPLEFYENIINRTVTIQLATNSQGQVTTTRSQLVQAFQYVSSNNISLLYTITGTGTQVLSPATFTCSGGSLGNEIASISLRASNYSVRTINKQLNLGNNIYVRLVNQAAPSFNTPTVLLYLSFV